MTTTFYRHWRDVPAGAWRWPSFSSAEIACRGTGKLLVNEAALDRLQALRDRLAKPLIVRSAFRSPAHNKAVGGAEGSKHLEGAAFDIAMANHDPHAFEAAAREAGFLGFGFYPEPRHDFMHIDLGPAREWGTRWPVTAATFTPEPPAPKPLAESRTMRGSGAAGLATVGPAGVEVAQEALAETRPSWSRWCPTSTRSAGCSSPPHSSASASPSTPAGTTGRRHSDDGGGQIRELLEKSVGVLRAEGVAGVLMVASYS